MTSNEQSRKLLPCPFCGGEAFLDNKYEYDSNQPYGSRIGCSDCSCIIWGDKDVYPKDLIKEWNTRHPPTAQSEEEQVNFLAKQITIFLGHGNNIGLAEFIMRCGWSKHAPVQWQMEPLDEEKVHDVLWKTFREDTKNAPNKRHAEIGAKAICANFSR